MNHRRITVSPDEIKAMINSGMTREQVAQQLGCSRSTVFNALNQARYEKQLQKNKGYKKRRRCKLIRYAGWVPGGEAW
jgi:DNA invertase Pin-like site-specific DNA recombinase